LRVSVGSLARVGISLSIAMSIAAILLSRFDPATHSAIASLALSTSFPLTVYIPFAAGLKGGSPRGGVEGLLSIISVALALLAPPLALYSKVAATTAASLGLVAATLFTWMQIGGRREPKLLFLYPPLAGALGMAYSTIRGLDVTGIALISAMSFTTPLIFTVSMMSTSRNYRVPATHMRVYVPIAVNAISLLSLAYSETLSLALYTLFLFTHFIAIGYYRFPHLLNLAKSSTPTYRAAITYMVAGHTSALLSAVLAAYHLAAGAPKVILIHMIYMGFIGSHIFLHTPLMIPFMLGVGSSRRYNVTPFIALLAALITRPIQPDVAYILVIVSLAALTLTMKP